MNAWVEKWTPYILAFIVSAGYLYIFGQSKLPCTISNLFTSVISISAVSIGFIATAQSILFTNHDSKAIKWIKDADLYETLIGYMMAAIHWCFVLAVISALFLLEDFSSASCYFPYFFAIWLFVCVTAFSACYRVVHLFSKILRAQ